VRLDDEAAFGERLSYAVSLSVQVRVAPALSLRLAPWFEYYHFEKSNVDYIDNDPALPFFEPASRTIWGGLAIDFVVHRRIRR
jgi:hypothetical protein